MIHQYRLNGYAMVLDVHSGAVHQVDDIMFDLIKQLDHPDYQDACSEEVVKKLAKTYDLHQIEQAFAELIELKKAGLLWSQDDYQQFFDKMEDAPIKAMCLHIAHDCNLRCKYCFASTGNFGSDRGLLSFETGKKAIDFLIHHSSGRKNLEVDFFGGEPLLNFEVIKKLVAYARSQEEHYHKNFRFTITTNGVLLDDGIIEYINKEMYNVVLSLDGRKCIHDALRPGINGMGSYDAIVPKYQALVKKRMKNKKNWQYYVRGTFTNRNLDFSKDVLHLHELGFEQLSIEPVVLSQEQPYALTLEDLPTIFKEYETLAQLYLKAHHEGNPFNFFHFMIDLDQGPCAIKRLRGCGSGNEYIAVTPQGDIYPCHQFVGMKSWKMGSVLDQTLNQSMKKQFAANTVYHKTECKNCWAKFYCSGGCHANHVQYGGALDTPYEISCLLLKKRLECALMIQAALQEDPIETL